LPWPSAADRRAEFEAANAAANEEHPAPVSSNGEGALEAQPGPSPKKRKRKRR
ncbi:MAG: hypothetical protein QOE08_2281, partial [Thermoleophilaceae bacterium]|nr:hypothetical protein [Thermoleophilaceae bacterium]